VNDHTTSFANEEKLVAFLVVVTCIVAVLDISSVVGIFQTTIADSPKVTVPTGFVHEENLSIKPTC